MTWWNCPLCEFKMEDDGSTEAATNFGGRPWKRQSASVGASGVRESGFRRIAASTATGFTSAIFVRMNCQRWRSL